MSCLFFSCVSKKEFNAQKEDFRTLKDDFRHLKRKIRSDQEQVDSDQPLEKKKSLSTAPPKILLTTSDEKELAMSLNLETPTRPSSLKSETPTSPSEMLSSNDEVKYNNHTTSDLEDSISHEDNMYSAVKF
ncbi:hypothetical protein DPMN_116013 [Dreissena polymorpha]|uniref:Uncharacterized protein n=1 Tax=Dreissena polymorpha TaxID=45954 RepID=A0A9D4KNK6_DREPO|nr:hypothetical protein DPMN_116013 [Dreissena polymorpha]